jgi:hypothetical protein
VRRILALTALAALSLTACAADNATLVARATAFNDASVSQAERTFFARGYRPIQSPTSTFRILDVQDCDAQGRQAESVEVEVGSRKATTTYAAACGLVMLRERQIAVKLVDEGREIVLTRAPYGSYARTTTGEIVRYTLVPRVKESKRGYLEGVSCCCNSTEPFRADRSLEVFVGQDPAREDLSMTYDIVDVTLCDPKAPQ